MADMTKDEKEALAERSNTQAMKDMAANGQSAEDRDVAAKELNRRGK